MPSINMIAARRAEKKRVEKMVYIALLVIVGELALTMGVVGFMTARVHAANSNIRQLDTQLTRLQPTVDRIQRYEGEIKELKPRLELLGKSRNQTLLWYAVLHDLASSMPEKTWLTSLATNLTVESSSSGGTTATPTVNISGSSISQKLVGDAMLSLDQCPEFSKVDLSYTQENQSGQSKLLRFQIAAKLRPNTPQKGGSSKDASNQTN